MTDGIIKGTGNSRYLKSVANALTLYPTHESLMEALAAGTLPIDLNGINPAGWTTQGMALNKANLLTDALCNALGISTASTPTQAMEKLRQMTSNATVGVNKSLTYEIGSYVGTTTNFDNTKNSTITINLSVEPVLFFISTPHVFLFSRKQTSGTTAYLLLPNNLRIGNVTVSSFGDKKVVLTGNNENMGHFNMNGSTYYYIVIGENKV